MPKRKIITPYNGLFVESYEPVSTMPDMCIPDQTMSIREILDRYTRGLPISQGKVPVYNNDDEELNHLAHLDRMELTDRMTLLQTYTDRKKDLEDKYRSEQQDALKQSIIDEYKRSLPTTQENPKS